MWKNHRSLVMGGREERGQDSFATWEKKGGFYREGGEMTACTLISRKRGEPETPVGRRKVKHEIQRPAVVYTRD